MTFWLPVAALWKRELVRFWRQRSRMLGVVASPLVFWLLIGAGFGNLGFFFPGTVALTVMFSAVFSTMSIIEDRREGFLLSMLVSPASRLSMVLGKILGASTLAWIQGAVLLAFMPLAGLHPPVSAWLGLAGAIFLVSFAITALGFLLAWRMESTQGFHAVMNLVLFPLWLVSGSMFPMSGAHGWMKAVMWVNPFTYSLSLLRGLMNPPAVPSLETSFWVTLAFALLLLAAAAWVAGRQPSRSNA